MVQLEKVAFRYRKKPIFNDLNAEFSKGEIVGIIGPNGSGKTTFLKLLAGYIRPQSGTISISETCMALIEEPAFYPDLTGKDNLEYFLGKTFGDQELQHLPFSCEKFLNLPVKKYSMGMRQKLALCMLILSDAEVLLLDEPTNALDQEALQEFAELMKREKSGRIIIVSSHALTELEKIADSIYMISDRKFSEKVAIGKNEEETFEIRFLFSVPETVRKQFGRGNWETDTLLNFIGTKQEFSNLIAELVKAGAAIAGADRKQSFLERFYSENSAAEGTEDEN